jgi:hypothetical protein
MFVFRRDPTFLDASARRDPLIRRVHDLREIVIRQHAIRHVAAGADD